VFNVQLNGAGLSQPFFLLLVLPGLRSLHGMLAPADCMANRIPRRFMYIQDVFSMKMASYFLPPRSHGGAGGLTARLMLGC